MTNGALALFSVAPTVPMRPSAEFSNREWTLMDTNFIHLFASISVHSWLSFVFICFNR
jgi:hypothetical protein